MYIISRKFQWIFPSVLTVTKLHVKHGWFEQFMWWKSTYWSSVHLINHAFLINKKCEKERSREREIENHLCFKWLSTHFFSLIGSLRIYFGCKLVTSLLYQKSKGCFVNILFYSAVFDISPFDASKAWWVLIIARSLCQLCRVYNGDCRKTEFVTLTAPVWTARTKSFAQFKGNST